MAVMDILIKAVDQASSVIESIGQKGEEAGKKINVNWNAVAVASAAAGAGMEAMARKQAPLTEDTRKLAASLNMTEKEMRDLTVATSNVTFPLEDVVGLFEIARQRGLESAEQLQAYATFWDVVGDATGESAVALADAAAGLKSVGISAGDEGKALSAFGFIAQETTSDVSEFLRFLERAGPELNQMGMSVDDAAAVLGALEHELGMSAKMAKTEFSSAVREADGDLDSMLQILGLTKDEFAEYQQKVSESSDVIQRNADIHAASYTPLQKLGHAANEAMYAHGALFEAAGQLAPVFMTLGPVIKGLSAAKGVWATVTSGSLIPAITGAIASTWSFTAALLANPITWIVVLIMGLIAALVLLWKNWDEVSGWVSEKFVMLKEVASEVIQTIIRLFSELPIKMWEFLKQILQDYLTWRRDLIESVKVTAMSVVDTAVDYIKELPPELLKIASEAMRNFIGGIRNRYNDVKDAATGVKDTIWDTLKNLPGELLTLGWQMISNLASGIMDGVRGVLGNAVSSVKDALNSLNPFARQSPSLVDNVQAGVKEIIAQYGKVKNIDIKNPDFDPDDFDFPDPKFGGGGNSRVIVFERGAFDGVMLMDDYTVDRFMDKVISRLQVEGG